MKKFFLKNKLTKEKSIKEVTIIPGVGKSLATDLWNIGITSIADLKAQNPEKLYDLSNAFAGTVQDRCVLYVFKCAVYYADTPKNEHETEKLKWWNWKDKKTAYNTAGRFAIPHRTQSPNVRRQAKMTQRNKNIKKHVTKKCISKKIIQ